MNEMMNDGKHYIEKEYASKGVAGTALGIGIGALGLEVLRNGGLQNILGTAQPQNQEETAFGLYKSQRDADDSIIAKHNKDSFDLYKYTRDSFDAVLKEIAGIQTKIAVAEATAPWKEKSIYDAIALEKERREAADCTLVGYMNCTFVPQYIADMTPAATSAQKTVFNPLNCLKPSCGCNN